MAPWLRYSPRGHRVQLALGFVLAVVLLYVALPRGKRFYYEFQEGKPWLYQTLKAPFDFPLLKSREELRKERERLLRSQAPIFVDDTTVVHRVFPQLLNEVRAQWLRAQDTGLRAPGMGEYTDSALQASLRRGAHWTDTSLRASLHLVLDYLYRIGVVHSATVLQVSSNSHELSIYRAGITYLTDLQEVYTPRTAEAFLRHNLAKVARDGLLAEVLARADFQSLLEPNLRYDSVLNAELRSERLAQLSTTKGLILAGEVVVTQGSLITPATYQKLESLRQEYASRHRKGVWAWATEIAYLLLIGVPFGLFYLFVRTTYPELLLRSNRKGLIFLLMLITLTALMGFLLIRSAPGWLYVLPVVIVPVYVRTFYDQHLAIVSHLMVTSLIAFFAPGSFAYFAVMLAAGSVAITTARDAHRRGKLIQLVLLILAAYVATFLLISTIQEGSWRSIDFLLLPPLFLNALIVLALYQLMAPIERVFGFISKARLIELCDTSNPLLRRLSEEAPGTFQHSLQVAALAEYAAERIGADALLVRTGAMYHDVGKLSNPQFFTENVDHGASPHRDLTYLESARIIIGHVEQGLVLARRSKLPEEVTHFIRTHHGTSQAKYFYINFQNENPETYRDFTDQFSYPGPRPFTREQAILMMADSIEAASRSLRQPTEVGMKALIESIISQQAEDGQFAHARLTDYELQQLKEIFLEKLVSINHTRIAYPDLRA